MAFFKDAFRFGTSWTGMIFNPVGYLAQRESVDKASDTFYRNNPINISGVETLEQLAIARANYVDACTAKLKSDDIGKNRTKVAQSCEGKFNANPEVQQALQSANIRQQIEDEEQRKMTVNIMIGIGVLAIIFLIVWLLK